MGPSQASIEGLAVLRRFQSWGRGAGTVQGGLQLGQWKRNYIQIYNPKEVLNPA